LKYSILVKTGGIIMTEEMIHLKITLGDKTEEHIIHKKDLIQFIKDYKGDSLGRIYEIEEDEG
jgi:hypothetical protein